MSEFRVAAIIPARMGSTRFPGKPLLEIEGLPMIEHVRRRVELSQCFSDVVVATCDKEIFDVVKARGGNVVMTSPRHPGATDRVSEAAQNINCSHVVNVQGDEILILPEKLKILVDLIKKNPKKPAWNAMAPITSKEELSDTSFVKCVVSRSNRILFCSRDFSRIPFKGNFEPIKIILGILAYQKSFLKDLGSLKRTPAEMVEGIDQNRILEHDIELTGVNFLKGYPGINEKREVPVVETILKTDPHQKNVLSQIKEEVVRI